MLTTALKERLQKIRAIADGATNEHECSTALLMYQKLMKENHLTEEEVFVEEQKTKITSEEVSNQPRQVEWKHQLYVATANHYRCLPYTIKNDDSISYRMAGLKEDVLIAMNAYETTVTAAVRLADEKKHADPAFCRRDFLRGFVIGVIDAYEQQEKNDKELHELIVSRPPEIKEYLENVENINVKKVGWTQMRPTQTIETKMGWKSGYNVGKGNIIPQTDRD